MNPCKRKLDDKNSYLLNIKLLTIQDDFEATQSTLTFVDATLRDITMDEEEANNETPCKETIVEERNRDEGIKHTHDLPSSNVTTDPLQETPKLRPRQQFIDSLQYKGNINLARTAISSMVKSYISSNYANDLQKPCPHCSSTEITHAQQLADIRMWRKAVVDNLANNNYNFN